MNKRNSDSSSSVSSSGMTSSSSSVSLSSASTCTSGGTSPEPGSTSKRRFLPWRRRSRESLSQEIPRTPVFFASIDQRDDSAGGESACTALVAVLAAALHGNHPAMPTRAELDALIRGGSSEWRKLCGDEAHMERFPNRHFDLETVLAARTRPIAVRHDRAFVGFFQPESFASPEVGAAPVDGDRAAAAVRMWWRGRAREEEAGGARGTEAGGGGRGHGIRSGRGGGARMRRQPELEPVAARGWSSVAAPFLVDAFLLFGMCSVGTEKKNRR